MSFAGKPLSNYRLHARQPPPSSARMRAIVRPPLWEFVLLSMLVHTTVILMFGAPSGGSREGRAMWGALQVVLQGAPVDAGPSLKIDRGVGVDRTEIAKKAPAPTPRVVPEPSRVDPVMPPLKLESRVAPVVLPPMDAPVELPPKDLPPVVIPPLLDRIVTPDRTPELTPFRMPPPTPAQVAPPPVPTPLPVPLQERVVIPHTEIAPVASPVIPALPTLPALPALPPVQRPPVEVPALPAPATEIAPTQQVPLSTPPGPAPAPQLPQQREAPARVDRVPFPREESGLPSAPLRPSGPSIDSPGTGTGQTPATKLDPSAPTLDLDAMRARAGELARSGAGNRAVLPFPMPPVPPKKSKMETAIENARKPDCRTAYAQLGLAAVVPLIANEFGEGSCRW